MTLTTSMPREPEIGYGETTLGLIARAFWGAIFFGSVEPLLVPTDHF